MMDSIDTSHVAPPDPANFWKFAPGRRTMVSLNPSLYLTLDRVEDGRARFLFDYDLRGLKGRKDDWLNLDRPCVAIRSVLGEPLITLTLREIRGDVAYLQMSAHPRLRQVSRSDVQ